MWDFAQGTAVLWKLLQIPSLRFINSQFLPTVFCKTLLTQGTTPTITNSPSSITIWAHRLLLYSSGLYYCIYNISIALNLEANIWVTMQYLSSSLMYEGRTESHEQLCFACELGRADEGECGGRWNQLLCYPWVSCDVNSLHHVD